MKKTIIRLTIGLISIAAGYLLLEKSGKVVSQQKYDEARYLCENAIKTDGMLQDSITEVALKLGRVASKTYELQYDFEVNNATYKSKKTVAKMNEVRNVTNIWYDPRDPSQNSTIDPCKTLAYYENSTTVGSEMMYLIPGAILGLLGISIVWGTIKKTIKVALTKK